MYELNEKIKNLRKEKQLTQEALARQLREKFGLNTDRPTISKWEIGFQTPEMYAIICLAEIFEVSVDYLNGTSDDKSKSLTENEIDSKVLNLLSQLSPDKKLEALRFLQFQLGDLENAQN